MTTQSFATLKVQGPNGSEKTFSLQIGQAIRIGRDESNDIIMADPGASRLHATISASKKGVLIADRSSLNGTFVNGKRLATMQNLNSGDIIDIGATKITLLLRSAEVLENRTTDSTSRAMTMQMHTISVTVLVASVQNYYKMSEELPTDAVIKMLIQWCDKVKEIIRCHEGEIDKIVDSSIVSIWIGEETEQQAVKAVYSAQQIRQATDQLLAEGNWQFQDEFPWDVAITATTGRGLQGASGNQSVKGDSGFTVVGDPINDAFALQEYLEEFQVSNIISQETASHASALFQFEELGRRKLRENEIESTLMCLK